MCGHRLVGVHPGDRRAHRGDDYTNGVRHASPAVGKLCGRVRLLEHVVGSADEVRAALPSPQPIELMRACDSYDEIRAIAGEIVIVHAPNRQGGVDAKDEEAPDDMGS